VLQFDYVIKQYSRTSNRTGFRDERVKPKHCMVFIYPTKGDEHGPSCMLTTSCITQNKSVCIDLTID